MKIDIADLMAYNVNEEFLELYFATSTIVFRKGRVIASFADHFPLNGEEGSGLDVYLFVGQECQVKVRSESPEKAREFYEFICLNTGMPNARTGTNISDKKASKKGAK